MGQIDVALRYVLQRYPEQLMRSLVSPELRLRFTRWLVLRVGTAEPKLFRSLELSGGDLRRVLQVEIVAKLTDTEQVRILERSAQILNALREAEGGPTPPVEIVVLVLSAPDEPWSPTGELRISWPESEFSGIRFRIEPVCQRTVAELMARGGALWLVFSPLAADATVQAMRDVVAAIEREEPDEWARAELYAALLQMAELDPWQHNLRKEIEMMVEAMNIDVMMKSQTLREAFEQGYESGVQLALHRLVQRKIGRNPTDEERALLAARARLLDGEEVIDAALDLSGDALVAWLFGRTEA